MKIFVRETLLEVMHIKKNVYDSIIGTLLNISYKTKDTIKARLDLVEMRIRKQLALEKREQNTCLLPAYHTLSRKEKIELCQCLTEIKMPSGYLSNIQSLVSMKDLKLVELKSYDYHALMQ